MNPLVKKIVKLAAREWGVDVQDVLGTCRTHDLTRPRHVAMFLCYDLLTMSLPHIGRCFHRDHTTTLYGVRRARALEDANPYMRLKIARVRTDFNAWRDGYAATPARPKPQPVCIWANPIVVDKVRCRLRVGDTAHMIMLYTGLDLRTVDAIVRELQAEQQKETA